jgi:hypothetical protein
VANFSSQVPQLRASAPRTTTEAEA